MSRDSRGRSQPIPPQPYPGNAETFTGVYPWNAPKKSITGNQEIAPIKVTPLAAMIAAYHHDKQRDRTVEEIKRNASREKKIEHFEEEFYRREKNLEQVSLSKDMQRCTPALEVQADLNAQPKFIRQSLQQKIDYLRRESGDERTNEFLLTIIKSVLARLDAVRRKQQTIAFQHIAHWERLDDLLRLPELVQKEVKLLATMTATHMDMLLDTLASQLPAESERRDILRLYHQIAGEARKLCITPPHWHALDVRNRRRGEVPYHLIPGALARLRCADWWYRKLWRLRCEWREEQLRAVYQVHKFASAYVSYDALIHKREQRRRAAEFIRSHEMVSESGVSIDMETIVETSASNPRMRRNEMMTTMRGLENLAEMRSDCAVFYTITCPSRYHATLKNGQLNPKWNTSTVRESSDYLVNLFSGIRKRMHRLGLRWYGMRVAEPHHDGTVHWHLMCFMRKKDRKDITAVMREFAIRQDRAELGKDIKPRFKAELVTKRKGTPTSYIAKYISKNVDGQPLKTAIDKKTGQPLVSDESGKKLSETIENVVAWASLHRVRQFQFFGIPSRQTYRELRLLAGQLQRKLNPKKGAQLLADKTMDNVLAAADAGCIATYIIHQGGVLIPRKYHSVRTAYALSDTPNPYGEHGTQIFGIWSPRLGEESRICTHTENWKMVRKTNSDNSQTKPGNAGAGLDLDLDVDRKDGSPSLGLVAITVPVSGSGRKKRTTPPPDFSNFNSITYTQRREIRQRLREETKREQKKSPAQPVCAPEVLEIQDYAESIGIPISQAMAERLHSGEIFRIDGVRWRAAGGVIFRVGKTAVERADGIMKRVGELRGLGNISTIKPIRNK